MPRNANVENNLSYCEMRRVGEHWAEQEFVEIKIYLKNNLLRQSKMENSSRKMQMIHVVKKEHNTVWLR